MFVDGLKSASRHSHTIKGTAQATSICLAHLYHATAFSFIVKDWPSSTNIYDSLFYILKAKVMA